MNRSAVHVTLLTTSLDVSGAERVLALVAEGLAAAGYRVSVMGLQRRSGALAGLIRRRDVHVGDFGASSPLDLRVAAKLRRWLIEERVTVLYTFLFHAHVVGRFGARLAHTPRILSSQQVAAWGGVTRRVLDRWTARWCDCVVAVSESVRNDLMQEMRLPAERVRVIANAVEVASFTPTMWPFAHGRANGQIEFGSASRLANEKDHESLLKGFAGAWRTAPHLRLRLAGTGPLRPQLENLARSQGISDAVTFLGHVDDVRAFYDGLDVYVQPSRTEGLPCAVVEAMAMSRPVVATNVPGNRDAVAAGATGWLIAPESPEAWTSALLEAVRDPSRAVNFGLSGRRRAEELFDAALMIRSTVDLVDELASLSSRR